MKTCCAGHNTVEFSVSRCPVCENIERLDKINLRLQIRVEELERQVNKLTNTAVSNWNGGAC